ncbi:MAG: FtsB family cell division protein [Alphaproteobacteria bacterium]
MDLLREIRRRAQAMLGPLAVACVALYFGYYAVYGDRGVLAMIQLDVRIAEAQSILEVEAAKRDQLNRRVALLRPDGVDPDMLEERARVLLNFARSDDVVILDLPGLR